jgi:hypothetical protein
LERAVDTKSALPVTTGDYSGLVRGVSELLEAARRASARTVNAFMTATYWEVGRGIVEFEQGGEKRAGYGEELLVRLADDLTARVGRGFSRQNLQRFRQFYLSQPAENICSTTSGKLAKGIRATPSLESGEAPIAQTLSAKSVLPEIRPTPSSVSETASVKLQTSAQFPTRSCFRLRALRLLRTQVPGIVGTHDKWQMFMGRPIHGRGINQSGGSSRSRGGRGTGITSGRSVLSGHSQGSVRQGLPF